MLRVDRHLLFLAAVIGGAIRSFDMLTCAAEAAKVASFRHLTCLTGRPRCVAARHTERHFLS